MQLRRPLRRAPRLYHVALCFFQSSFDTDAIGILEKASGAAGTYAPPPWAAESATAVPSFAETATVSEDDRYSSLGLGFLERLGDLPHDVLMSGAAPGSASPSARSEVDARADNKLEVAYSIGQQVLTNGSPADDLQLLDV
ncbi:unnamed protein product [Prorocentrum cordatum]|uniref:Uncharacterized protein n=1 Tax=Prorocentrum cordatum TaxID=2364126 RepID=A0ABN9U3Q2_9DINO|nr:unnamed protein product [Polarella glacialis]